MEDWAASISVSALEPRFMTFSGQGGDWAAASASTSFRRHRGLFLEQLLRLTRGRASRFTASEPPRTCCQLLIGKEQPDYSYRVVNLTSSKGLPYQSFVISDDQCVSYCFIKTNLDEVNGHFAPHRQSLRSWFHCRRIGQQ